MEYVFELAELRALASDKPKFFESIAKEGSNVLLAINDADARPDLSPTEGRKTA
jgi:hypothetical protein